MSLLLLASLAALPACADLAVEKAWIRTAPPGARVMAAYADIRNRGDVGRMLRGGASPAFESVELHRTLMVDGMARMRHGEPLAVPAGEHVSLAPGGWHFMLLRPAAVPSAGSRIPVTLAFEDCTLEAIFSVGGGN